MKTNYEPFTTKYTPTIINDIKNCVLTTNKSQILIDTLDICHLLGEIERLNIIINEYDKYSLAIAKIRDLNNSLLNDKNFREMLNEILQKLMEVE